jgi:phenylalanyl-tRNA synthetase beta chain
LKSVNLFDVYRSVDQLGEDKKSYAVSFVFEDTSKTLKDKEITKIMDALMKEYQSKLSAQIRS